MHAANPRLQQVQLGHASHRRARCTRPFQSAQSRRFRRSRLVCRAESQQETQKSAPATSSVLSIFCPLLKLLSGGDPAAPRTRWAEVATSGFASIARLPFGTTVGPAAAARAQEPSRPMQLYEFEACPFCRRVREAVTDLDLEVDVFPAPKESVHHRAAAETVGGRLQFPLLVDNNTEPRTVLYESDEIVRYLYQNYGGGAGPPRGLLASTLVSGWVPTLLRAGRGMVRYERATLDSPPQLLHLFDYESNQFSRLVREALCELELPYRRSACGKGSRRRPELQKLAGSTRIPYLLDPNTGAAMDDSERIVRYLFDTYSTAQHSESSRNGSSGDGSTPI